MWVSKFVQFCEIFAGQSAGSGLVVVVTHLFLLVQIVPYFIVVFVGLVFPMFSDMVRSNVLWNNGNVKKLRFKSLFNFSNSCLKWLQTSESSWYPFALGNRYSSARLCVTKNGFLCPLFALEDPFGSKQRIVLYLIGDPSVFNHSTIMRALLNPVSSAFFLPYQNGSNCDVYICAVFRKTNRGRPQFEPTTFWV